MARDVKFDTTFESESEGKQFNLKISKNPEFFVLFWLLSNSAKREIELRFVMAHMTAGSLKKSLHRAFLVINRTNLVL